MEKVESRRAGTQVSNAHEWPMKMAELLSTEPKFAARQQRLRPFRGDLSVILLLGWWLLGLLGAEQASGQDVRLWGSATTFSERQMIPNSPVLIHAISHAAELAAGRVPPESAQAWLNGRSEKLDHLRKLLGIAADQTRRPPAYEMRGEIRLSGCAIQKLIFESRPGFWVTANLYRSAAETSADDRHPSQVQRHPAILCPVGHWLSAGKTASEVQSRCQQLARLGFVVLTYDPIGQGERMMAGNDHHSAGYSLLPLGETIAGWMVWDSMRAIDLLQSLPDVDPDRIGITGNSGGGLNTLLTAALDERVKCAVVVGFTFQFRHWLQYGGTHCTCTHFPGILPELEWFDVAGLIAPRPLLLLQGDQDRVFLISGARLATSQTATVYQLLNASEAFRFTELAGQPHAYRQPFREPMVGWMLKHLAGVGDGSARPEDTLELLPEQSTQLLCNVPPPESSSQRTVIEVARQMAVERLDALEPGPLTEADTTLIKGWARELSQSPLAHPHFLNAEWREAVVDEMGSRELFSFASEDGVRLPGVLWRPAGATNAPIPLALVFDARGKQAVASSELLKRLLSVGYGVVSVDLRGRGETLGEYQPGWNTNFRLVATQILAGQPLAGRRAYDVGRVIDLLASRSDLSLENLLVIGQGDDSLPSLLAALSDDRIQRLAVEGFCHSFVSQMEAGLERPWSERGDHWNDPQLTGTILTQDQEAIDFGAVIPAALPKFDVPRLVAALSPRHVWWGPQRDQDDIADADLVRRFGVQQQSGGGSHVTERGPAELPIDSLLNWIAATAELAAQPNR